MVSQRKSTSRRSLKPDRVRALELLDGCGDEGCTEGILRSTGSRSPTWSSLSGLSSRPPPQSASSRARAGWKSRGCGSRTRGGRLELDDKVRR